MRARSVAALASALAGAWAMAAPAAALEPGVFVDPGSPAGKEYSIPLSVLRGAASGHAPLGAQPQPLFGQGIGPARASAQGFGAGTAPRTGSPRPPGGQSGGGAGVYSGTGGGSGGRATRGARAGTSASASGAGRPGTSARASGAGRAGASAGASGAVPGRGPVLAALTRQGSPAPDVALIGALVVLGGFGLGALVAAARTRL
jgi:hypothetical protein